MNLPNDVARCENCRFAHKESPMFYTCRRNAPIAVHDPNRYCGVYPEAFQPRWPFMHEDDWCGNFEKRKGEEK